MSGPVNPPDPAVHPRELRRRLADAMSADHGRLKRDLDRWRPEQPDAAARLAAIAVAIEASVAQSETRRARLPDLVVPEELPIAARSEESPARPARARPPSCPSCAWPPGAARPA
jgi:hypothetical protein